MIDFPLFVLVILDIIVMYMWYLTIRYDFKGH